MAQKEAAGKLTIPYEFLVHRPRSERRPGLVVESIDGLRVLQGKGDTR